jgi:hypothetical protein
LGYSERLGVAAEDWMHTVTVAAKGVDSIAAVKRAVKDRLWMGKPIGV